MKKIIFSPIFEKKLKELKRRDAKLFKKIFKQLKLFSTNPKHNSLRLHKLKGDLQDTWSLSVSQNFRLIFREDESYYFFDLGSHDEVYRK